MVLPYVLRRVSLDRAWQLFWTQQGESKAQSSVNSIIKFLIIVQCWDNNFSHPLHEMTVLLFGVLWRGLQQAGLLFQHPVALLHAMLYLFKVNLLVAQSLSSGVCFQ